MGDKRLKIEPIMTFQNIEIFESKIIVHNSAESLKFEGTLKIQKILSGNPKVIGYSLQDHS